MKRLMMICATVLGLGLALSVLMATAAEARHSLFKADNVLTVCPINAGVCDYHEIQEAVDAANDGDIVKISSGYYTGTHSKPVPAGYLGASSVDQVVYITKTITLQGGYTVTNGFADPPAPDNNPSILDAQGQGRVIFIAGEISPTLEGLLITGGSGAGQGQVGNWGIDAGGGMYVVSATTVISGNQIYSNSFNTGYGGGLYIAGGSVTIENNSIINNKAIMGAGVIIADAQAIVQNNRIISNTADGWNAGGIYLNRGQSKIRYNYICSNAADSGNGGGVYVYEASAELSHNTICSNTAQSGGGLAWLSEWPPLNPYGGTIQENQIFSNTAVYNGGGVHIDKSSPLLIHNLMAWNQATGGTGGGLYTNGYAGEVNQTGNIIIKNTAVRGGGMFFGGFATFVNTLIADNYASSIGSGVLTMHSSPQFVHSTFAGNTGGDGSAVHIEDTRYWHSPVGFTNTIIVNHTVGITVTENATVTIEGTLFGTGAMANGINWGGNGTVLPGLVEVAGDPDFANVGNNNFHICSNSDAIDAGINAGILVDIDGETRPDGSGYDIGYDEFIASTPIANLQLMDGILVSDTLTATLLWGAPHNAVTYTLKYSNSVITNNNWDTANVLISQMPGGTDRITISIPCTGSEGVYFALKYWDTCGEVSQVSKNVSWLPDITYGYIYLPLVMRSVP